MSSSVATVGDAVAVLHERYPPALAESWDAVGLVCGDPAEAVSRVLFAVDPVDEVVDEAIAAGVQLLVTHHPLLLRAVHGVPADDAKGRVVHRLVRAGIALLCAHTNADSARDGVSDALAAALGLADTTPLDPLPASGLDKLTVFVPTAHVDAVIDALAAAGAGQVGDYDGCAYEVAGHGRFRPLPGAQPHLGEIGRTERVAETRVEMVVPPRVRNAVVAALRAAHPYEEPAFDLVRTVDLPSDAGLGRVGELPGPETLADFARRVAAALPGTEHGVRVAGDPARSVRRVAVCGGAGDSLLEAVDRSGADVYLTSDLRHHRAQEHLAAGGCALVDVAHWAGEWPWLARAAELLRADLGARGATVETAVSTLVTDPWTLHLRSSP